MKCLQTEFAGEDGFGAGFGGKEMNRVTCENWQEKQGRKEQMCSFSRL